MMTSYLREGCLAVRPGSQIALSEYQVGMWDALDIGILVTDLEHISLVCNRKFGEIFLVDPRKVVTSSVEGLRKSVTPLISHPDVWERNLEDIYDNPKMSQRDHLMLAPGTRTIERYSAPVLDSLGEPIARMWTFRILDKTDSGTLFCGPVCLRPECRQASLDGHPIDLTRIEFDLLRFLVRNANSALSREEVFRHVWGYELDMNTNSLDVLISRIRKKISVFECADFKIETVYGFGYRLKAQC